MLDGFSIESGIVIFEISEVFDFSIGGGFGTRFCCTLMSFGLIVDEISELKGEFTNENAIEMGREVSSFKS